MAKVKEPASLYSSKVQEDPVQLSLQEIPNITITRKQGRAVRVSMSYAAYRKLREAYISQQIYNDPKTQESISRSKDDVKNGRFKTFTDTSELLRSLDDD
ncbi:MAG: hypothetical protein AAB071_06425 [Bacteroidota bacterium]